MGTQTGITWADATWNPWQGCTPASEACEHCYARRDMERYGRDFSTVKRSSTKTFNLPLAKKPDGSWKIPDGSVVFVCSWSDFFHENVPDDWRWEAFGHIDARPDLTFLILTKRPRAMREWIEMIAGEWTDSGTSREEGWLAKHRHIWLGVTAENQARADERIPKLLEMDWPGKKFVSIEPMLSPVDLSALPNLPPCSSECDRWLECQGARKFICSHKHGHDCAALDWIICGGESGPGARAFDVEWARSLRDQCKAARVAFHMKQLGGWPDKRKNLEDLPEDLRIRERP